MKRALIALSVVLALVLVAGCGGMEEDAVDVDSIVQAATVEPHCTNGDCTAYALWCMERGRTPMCLNPGDHQVTLCMGQRGANNLMQHHPAACYGTCYQVANPDAVIELPDGFVLPTPVCNF